MNTIKYTPVRVLGVLQGGGYQTTLSSGAKYYIPGCFTETQFSFII